MRIYFVTYHFPPIINSLPQIEWVLGLQEAGFEVTAVIPYRHPHPWREFDEDPDLEGLLPNIPVERIPIPELSLLPELLHRFHLLRSPHFFWKRLLTRRLTHLLCKAPGAVFVQAQELDTLAGASQAAVKAGCPWIALLSGRDPLLLHNPLLRSAALLTVRHKAAVATLRADPALTAIPLTLCPHGICRSSPAGRLPARPKKIVLHYLDDLGAEGRPEEMARAWHQLLRESPSLARQFLIRFIGLPSSYTRRHLFPLLLDGHLECTGFLSQNALDTLLPEADLTLVNRSPQSFYNSLGHGVPIWMLSPEDEERHLLIHYDLGYPGGGEDTARRVDTLKEIFHQREALKNMKDRIAPLRSKLLLREEVYELGCRIRKILEPKRDH